MDDCKSGIIIEDIENLSVADLVRRLANRYDDLKNPIVDSETNEISGEVIVVLNGRIVGFGEAEKTALRSGDEILLIPILDGG